MDVAKIILAIFYILFVIGTILIVILIGKKAEVSLTILNTKDVVMSQEILYLLDTYNLYTAYKTEREVCYSYVKIFDPLKKTIEAIPVESPFFVCKPKSINIQEKDIKDVKYDPDLNLFGVGCNFEGKVRIHANCTVGVFATIKYYNSTGWQNDILLGCIPVMDVEGICK